MVDKAMAYVNPTKVVLDISNSLEEFNSFFGIDGRHHLRGREIPPRRDVRGLHPAYAGVSASSHTVYRTMSVGLASLPTRVSSGLVIVWELLEML